MSLFTWVADLLVLISDVDVDVDSDACIPISSLLMCLSLMQILDVISRYFITM